MSELVLSPFAQKGEAIYRDQILPEISEETLKGKIVAIEVESGDYFIDEDSLKAITRAQTKHPAKMFYLKRIGYRAVHKSYGVVKRAAA